MTEILPMFTACMLLSILSHRRSVFDITRGEYKRQDAFFYAVLSVIIIVFAGLRNSYNDTATYLIGFENLAVNEGWLFNISLSVGDYPLYNITNYLLKSMHFSSHAMLMFYSLVTYGIQLWFIRKYTNNIWFSLLLFFTLGCFEFALAAVKQCVAASFCLLAVDRLIEKKAYRFILWVVVGTLYHPFAALFIICPLLRFRPWTKPAFFTLLICALIGFSLQTWLSSAVNVLSLVGVDYDTSLMKQEGVNVFRVLVLWVPLVLSLMDKHHWKNSDNAKNNLMINLSLLCAELMFIALFGDPIYFGRLANYFLVFQIISVPIIISRLSWKTRGLVVMLAVVFYSAYWVYGCAFHGATFDTLYDRMTVFSFIRSFFI